MAIELHGDGDSINRDAIGARVTMSFADESIIREKKSSRGMYNSEDTRVLHFGIGDRDCDYSIEVRWPDGETATFTHKDFSEDSFIRITYPNAIESL